MANIDKYKLIFIKNYGVSEEAMQLLHGSGSFNQTFNVRKLDIEENENRRLKEQLIIKEKTIDDLAL